MSELHTTDDYDITDYNPVSQLFAGPFDDFTHFLAEDVVEPVVDYLHDTSGWDIPGFMSHDPSQYVGNSIDAWTSSVTNFLEPLLDWIAPRPVPAPALVGVETNPGPPKVHTAKPQPAKQVPKAKQHQPQQKQRKNMAHNTSMSKPASVAVAYGAGVHVGVPKISRSNDSCVIEHTELIANILGQVPWTTTTAPMQPGLSSVFAWLSTQTAGWEKYRWRRLVLTYVTRSGSSTIGSVYLCPDYDAADAAPTDEKSASSYFGTSTDAPWKEIVCVTDMRRSKEFFIRRGPLAANLDIKMYDFCSMFFGTTDASAANQPWGKIYASYVVELINPEAVAPVNVGATLSSGGGSITNALPFGAVPFLNPGSYLASVSGQVVSYTNMTVGQAYTFSLYAAGTGITGIVGTLSAGLTTKSGFGNVINPAGTNLITMFTAVANAPTGSITFNITNTTLVQTTLISALITNAGSI